MPSQSLLTRRVTDESAPFYKEGHTLYHKHSSDTETDKAVHAKQKFSFSRRFRSQRRNKQGIYGGGIGDYGNKRTRNRNTWMTKRGAESWSRGLGDYDTKAEKEETKKAWEGKTHIFKHPKKKIYVPHVKSKFI